MKNAHRIFLIMVGGLILIAIFLGIGSISVLKVPTTAMEPTFQVGDHVLFRYKRGLTEVDRERVVFFMVSSVPYLYDAMQREERIIKELQVFQETKFPRMARIFLSTEFREVLREII